MADWQNLLIAVNGTETAMRAVRYVGRIAGAVSMGSISLLYIFPDPPPDFFTQGGKLEDYEKEMQEKGEHILAQAKNILADYGLQKEAIISVVEMAEDKTISQKVVEVQERLDCGTVVVGKRGVCKAEEFLFGSISNSLAREARGFTTWVVG